MSLGWIATKTRAGAGAATWRLARWSVAARLRNIVLLRTAAFLFIVPNAIMALGLAPAPQALLLLGCVLATIIVAQLDAPARQGVLAQKLDLHLFLWCALAALALCSIGEQGHYLFASADWLARDALLSDLVRKGFPLVYALDGREYLLRAPLGFYMGPALVGGLFGMAAAHVALAAQMIGLLTIVLYFLARLADKRKFVVLLLFVAFSGLDLLGALLNMAKAFWRGDAAVFNSDVELWNEVVQYSAHVTQLFWSPHHTLPAWWLALLVLFAARREIDATFFAVASASMLFWSPFSVIGALPFLVYFTFGLSRRLFEPRVLLAGFAALCFAPVALFLQTDTSRIEHGFLLGAEGFGLVYLVFVAIEAPHLAVLAFARRHIPPCDRNILVVAAAALLLIPFYKIGATNPFAMRASVVPLFIVGFVFARISTVAPRDGGRLSIAISFIVLVSAATPLLEIRRALATPAGAASCNFMARWRAGRAASGLPTYFVPLEHVPSWLMTAEGDRLTPGGAPCGTPGVAGGGAKF